MIREIKAFLAFLAIVLGLAVTVAYGTKLPDPRGWFTIEEDGLVHGVLRCDQFSVTLGDTEILVEDTALGVGQGTWLDYAPIRVEILKNIFGNIAGITGLAEGDEFLISDLADLESYVLHMQQIGIASQNTLYNIVPEESAFTERYLKNGHELTINHRDNVITYFLPTEETLGLENQLQSLHEFALALGVDSCLDIDNPQITEDGIILPIRIDGVPLVAASKDFLLDRNQELWVLQFLGYDSTHIGFSLQAIPGGYKIQGLNIILPTHFESEKESVITVEAALEALRDNLNTIYTHGRYSDQHDYYINQIRLAYGAVYCGGGEYSLEPIYVFINDIDLAWAYCFFVNAHTGEVYPAIGDSYSETINPLRLSSIEGRQVTCGII